MPPCAQCYVVFDIVYLSGNARVPDADGPISDWPLSRRRQILPLVVSARKHRLEILPFQVVCARTARKRLDVR